MIYVCMISKLEHVTEISEDIELQMWFKSWLLIWSKAWLKI